MPATRHPARPIVAEQSPRKSAKRRKTAKGETASEGKNGGPKEDALLNLPLDVLTEVLRYSLYGPQAFMVMTFQIWCLLTPTSLMAFSQVKRVLRRYLLSDEYVWVWTRVRKAYGGPDPLDGASERGWFRLLYGEKLHCYVSFPDLLTSLDRWLTHN